MTLKDLKLSSKSDELKSALANGAIPYSADIDFFFFEIEVLEFEPGAECKAFTTLYHRRPWYIWW